MIAPYTLLKRKMYLGVFLLELLSNRKRGQRLPNVRPTVPLEHLCAMVLIRNSGLNYILEDGII